MSAIRPMRRQLWIRIGRKGVQQRPLLDGMVDHVPIDSNAGIATRVPMS